MTRRGTLSGLFRPPLTGRHVLFMLLAFFFVIFAVNGVFVYVSLNSHPGVTSDKAYRKGLDFNRTLEAADRQNALGWRHRLVVENGNVQLTLADRSGRPITGLRIDGQVRRPIHDRADAVLDFRETAAGTYRAKTQGLTPGRWQIRISTRYGNEPYRMNYDVEVRP